MSLGTGSTLGGRYTLGSAIASGGMGDVWEATDEVLQRPVAVKVMRPQRSDDEAAFAERFRDEARGSASLHHPNIASVFDYGEQDGTAYLVMELVPGRTLGDLIRESGGGMPPAEVRSILGQAALALSAAHGAGVVHRDVKPANIIVTPEGQAKLTDFGIARVGDGSGHTLTGEVLGTPDYLSPEQALGQPATAASDIYSLGIVVHEMITGRKPFDMGTPVATALAQVNDPPPSLPDTVPADLRAVVVACLAKSAADRPSDARTVAEAAGVPLGSLPGVTPPPLTAGATETIAPVAVPAVPAPVDPTMALPLATDRRPRPGGGDPSPARHRAWLAVTAVVLVAAGAFALGSLMNGPSSATPETRTTSTRTTPPTTTTPTRTAAPAGTPTTAAGSTTVAAGAASRETTAATRVATAAKPGPKPKPHPARPTKDKAKDKAKDKGKGKAK